MQSNGNKFEKILNVSGNKSPDDDLKKTGYNRVIVGTNKEGVAYDNTLKAINSVFGEGTTITNEKIGSLTVLTNSDLSEGMFVLVPADGTTPTTTVTVTVNGTAVKADATAELSDDKKTVTIAAAEGVTNVNSVDGYEITVADGKITIKKTDKSEFTTVTIKVDKAD